MEERDKSTVVVSAAKLKREDCQRTKLDSAFSDWKTLVGPTDWEDHSLKKEGAEKYRTNNLPNCASCSGVYEFGIALLPTQSGREVGKLKIRSIFPVYIGHAENVRTRLQHYGRDGSHLENSGFSKGEPEGCKRNGLFRDTFTRGFSIVYRWAPMENKSEAERKEAQLLKTYDYAWNKGSNGARRPNDIHQKPYSHISKSLQFPLIFKKHQFLPGPVSKLAKEVKVQAGDAEESKTFYNGIVCGVDFEDRTFCTKPPVLGRHRCEEHKGMRVQMPKSKVAYISSVFIDTSHQSLKDKSGSSRAVVKNESSLTCGATTLDGSFCKREPGEGGKQCWQHEGTRVNRPTPKPVVTEIPSRFTSSDVSVPICGATTEDGSFCRRKTGEGGKRCWQHEGTRVNGPTPKPVVTEIPSRFTGSDVSIPTCGATTEDGSFCRRKPCEGGKRCWQHIGTRVNGPAPESIVTEKPSRFTGSDVSVPTCGATTEDGSFCRRKPGEGGKRCWQHKGTRVNGPAPEPVVTEIPSRFTGSDVSVPTCGATTEDGSFCRRKPGEGGKRCWQHKGTRVNGPAPEPVVTEIPSRFTGSDVSVPTCGATTEDGSFCRRKPGEGGKRCWQHKGTRVNGPAPEPVVTEIPSRFTGSDVSVPTCGATTEDGSFCRRKPGEGGKRCWQHKGTRVNGPAPEPVVTEIPSRFTGSDVSVPTCGATTEDGSFCRRKPGEGGKRCWQHKGTRVNGPAPEPIVTEKPSRFAGSDVSVSTCGATTKDGSSCRRKPSNGSNWCWQHEGTRVASNSRTSVWYEPKYNDTSYRSVSYFSSTCGAITLKGTYCSRAPAAGRRRCWQH